MMSKYIRISKYHVGIIVFYILVTSFLWKISPNIFQYKFTNQNIKEVITLIIVSLLGFAVYLHLFKQKEIKVLLRSTLSKVPFLVVYALFFAFCEEVIFRGVIQNYLQAELSNISLAVFLASLAFGFVHLPNGARGINPRRWNWQFAIVAFLGGLIFGEIFALTGNLLVSTLLHTFILFVLMVKAVSE